MPGPKRLIAAGVALFLIGLVVLFPARAAYQWFAPEDLRLSGISGTVWDGAAIEGTAGGFYLGNLRWDFNPLLLFTGKAGYSIAAEPVSGFIESDVAISPSGTLHFSDLTAALTVASLGNLLPMSGAEGAITVQFASLVARDGVPIEADGTIEIANLTLRGLSQSPLGSYRVVFETIDDVITGHVEDLSGMLDVTGTIQLRPDRSYTFTGQVAATNQAPDAIVQQLQYLGSPNAEGQRTFRFEGQF